MIDDTAGRSAIKCSKTTLVIGLLAYSAVSQSATNWVDWVIPAPSGSSPTYATDSNYPFRTNDSGEYTVYRDGTTGTVTKFGAGSVGLVLEGEVLSLSADNANNWVNGENTSDAYDFGTGNSPEGSDRIGQTGYTQQEYKAHTVSFDESVDGVMMAIWSLGGGITVSSLLFSEDFIIVDTEDTGAMTKTVTAEGYQLSGIGAAGLIQFCGTGIDSISYTVTAPEIYSAVNVGLTDNTLTSDQLTNCGSAIAIDETAPSVVITASETTDGTTSSDSALSLTFTLSESAASSGTGQFTQSDVTVTNGVLSAFTGSGTTYTATFTPAVDGATTINVAGATFSDPTGNNNEAADEFNWTYVADAVSPSIVITAAEVVSGSASDDERLNLTFTVNEDATGFAADDVTLTNATLSAFTQVSASVYSAVLTPTTIGVVTVNVAAAQFLDAAGNDNLAAPSFTWTYGVDPTQKTEVIASMKAMSEASSSFALTTMRLVSRRLNWLDRNEGSSERSRQGVQFNFEDPVLQAFFNGSDTEVPAILLADASTTLRQLVQDPEQLASTIQADAVAVAMTELRAQIGSVNLNPTSAKTLGVWSVWTEGDVTVGSIDASSSNTEQDSTRFAVTVGIDKDFTPTRLVGYALTFGQETIDVGEVSDIDAHNISASVYGSQQLDNGLTLEGVLGLGRSDLEITRADGSQVLKGQRDADLVFASLTGRGATYEVEAAAISPYVKAELAHVSMDAFRENGGSMALEYGKQSILNKMLSAGVDVSYQTGWRGGRLAPFARAEVTHDFTGETNSTLRYVAGTTLYRVSSERLSDTRATLTLGADYQVRNNLTVTASYDREEVLGAGHFDSATLRLSFNF